MNEFLLKLEERLAPLALEREAQGLAPPLVLCFGHSMAGAAIGVLTGLGQCVENESYLGFDGKYILPNATPTMLFQASR